jgi:cellulose synthase/poly-beta-1,6-N-acetylglucosamine synthase-like glycosyltransferase
LTTDVGILSFQKSAGENMFIFLMRLWRQFKHYLRVQSERLFPVILVQPDRKKESSKPNAISLSVIIPALNEERQISSVIAFALKDKLTKEVIVVDDSSIDQTAELAKRSGAQVIRSSMLGKGASMHDGLMVAQHDYILYLDGDLKDLSENLIAAMLEPLQRDQADFVKAKFGRGPC